MRSYERIRTIYALVLCFALLALCQAPAQADGFLWETGAVPDSLTTDPRVRDVRQADGFRLVVNRTQARPGERYVEVLLVLDEEPGEGVQLAWRAELADVPSNRTLASARSETSSRRTLLSVDVRRHEVRDARLRVELHGPRGQIGAAELPVGAAPWAPAPERRVPVLMDKPEDAELDGKRTVAFGVPFPAGALWEPGNVRVVDVAGREYPSQTEATALWGREGSIRWLRVDAKVPVNAGVFLERRPAQARPETPVVVERGGDAVIVRVADAEYILAPGASPIRQISFRGQPAASSEGVRGLYVVDQTGRLAQASADNEMRVEADGPVAASVRFEGFYRTGDGTPLARHITRAEFFAGRPSASVTHTLVLTEDTNEVWFDEIGWEMAVSPGEGAEALFGVSPRNAFERQSVALNDQTPGASVFQRDYVQFGGGEKHFQILELDAEGAQVGVLAEGAEMGDWGMVRGAGGGLLVSCREAARQHPKEIVATADRLNLRLFSPRAGDSLDFRPEALLKRWNRGDGVSESDAKELLQVESNAAGWAKTHEILIHPVGRGGGDEAAMAASELHSRPVYASIAPEWIRETRIMGPLHPKDEERFPAQEEFVSQAMAAYFPRGHERDGQYGFVDYFAGPHYRSVMGDFHARHPITYAVRMAPWLLYARSGERELREFAQGTNRRFLDNIVSHWNQGDAIKGLYRSGGGMARRYPLYWLHGALPYGGGGPNSINQFLWDYHLTGNRRAGELAENFAQGMQQWWEPGRRVWYRLKTLRNLWLAYAETWNQGLRPIIEDMMEHTYDYDGAVGVRRDAIPNYTTYKTPEDTLGIVEAWEMLGDRRCFDLAKRLAEHNWGISLGQPMLTSRFDKGGVGDFLYRLTGDPSIPEELARAVREAPTGSVTSDVSVANPRLVGIPYALSVIAEAGADREPAASWAAFDSFGYPASFVVKKGADESHGLRAHGRGFRVETVGAMPRDRLVSVFERPPAARINLPYDTPAGAYRISAESEQAALFADGKRPLVVHAPEYWRPSPPAQVPPLRIYFKVPEDSAHQPAVFFEAPTRLFDPAGRPFAGEEEQRGWVNLPQDAPGLWSFEADKHFLARVRNLPPFFAAGSPDNYFEPEIEWETAPPPEEVAIPPADEIFVKGRGREPGDMALHLDGSRYLAVQAGPEHPSGDGGQFLPHTQGTVEFFLKPFWDTFDLFPSGTKNLLLFRTEDRPWHLRYLVDETPSGWPGAEWRTHVFEARLVADSPLVRRPIRPNVCHRRTIVEKGEWMHIALTWGEEEFVHARTGRQTRLHVRLYVNGTRGRNLATPRTGERVRRAPSLMELGRGMAGLVDGLRISDVARYDADFEPPTSETGLGFDDRTRLLMWFNGDLEAKSYGWEGPLPEGAVELAGD